MKNYADDNEVRVLTSALRNDGDRGKEPLRVCVKDAVEQYFLHLDGHEASGVYRMVMEQVEPPLLESVLERTGGNQSKAAEILGINRGTLRKKLKHYDLDY